MMIVVLMVVVFCQDGQGELAAPYSRAMCPLGRRMGNQGCRLGALDMLCLHWPLGWWPI